MRAARVARSLFIFSAAADLAGLIADVSKRRLGWALLGLLSAALPVVLLFGMSFYIGAP
jgi:hypothetical protein